MANAPTVIARFLNALDFSLNERGAQGAARRVFGAAATFEPVERSADHDSEQERLLLLARRVSARWVPACLEAPGDAEVPGLPVAQLPVIRERADADLAAQAIGELRAQLRGQGRIGPRRVDSAELVTALALAQGYLRDVSRGDPTRPQDTAVTAVPKAAGFLVSIFFLGAAFKDDLPGEARATVDGLDRLDDEAELSWGSPANERIARESDLHRDLVADLVSELAKRVGEVIEADGVGTLPEPRRVGRHQPDAVARSTAGEPHLGEAKLGPELGDAHTQEQLADFLDWAAQNGSTLHLIVPSGWRAQAEEAARQAADTVDNLVVIELEGLVGAPQPDST